MYHGVNPYEIVIPMADFTCYFCGEQVWVYVPTEEMKNALQCKSCNAWLADMNNQGAIEYNIRKFQDTQY